MLFIGALESLIVAVRPVGRAVVVNAIALQFFVLTASQSDISLPSALLFASRHRRGFRRMNCTSRSNCARSVGHRRNEFLHIGFPTQGVIRSP